MTARRSQGWLYTALNPFATSRHGIASQMSIDLFMSWNPTQDRKKNFPLELRAKKGLKNQILSVLKDLLPEKAHA